MREGGRGRGAKREIEKKGGREEGLKAIDLLWSRVLLLKDLIFPEKAD